MGCLRTLPLDAFYAHPQSADGRISRCKECVKAAMKAAYWKDPETARANERKRSLKPARRKQLQASLRRQREANPEKFNRKSAAWATANPEKRKAHVVLNNAVRDGRVKKGPCEGGGKSHSGKVQGHHEDYSKPLEVRWLCTRCHGLEHRGRNEMERRKV